MKQDNEKSSSVRMHAKFLKEKMRFYCGNTGLHHIWLIIIFFLNFNIQGQFEVEFALFEESKSCIAWKASFYIILFKRNLINWDFNLNLYPKLKLFMPKRNLGWTKKLQWSSIFLFRASCPVKLFVSKQRRKKLF